MIVAALNNLYPVVTRRLWLVAFGFGLIHGLGFAAVLADFGLAQGALGWALFGFNLGVEAGQLAIVAAVFPMIFVLRRWRPYPRLALGLGSLAIVMISSLWLFERALGVTFAMG